MIGVGGEAWHRRECIGAGGPLGALEVWAQTQLMVTSLTASGGVLVHMHVCVACVYVVEQVQTCLHTCVHTRGLCISMYGREHARVCVCEHCPAPARVALPGLLRRSTCAAGWAL